MITKEYAESAWNAAAKILSIDSPTGFTAKAAQWAKEAFENLGFAVTVTEKGGVLVDLGGENAKDGLLLAAHADTLGAMVAQVKGNGRLRLTNIGGMNANNAEAENAILLTRSGKKYEGTLQLGEDTVFTYFGIREIGTGKSLTVNCSVSLIAAGIGSPIPLAYNLQDDGIYEYFRKMLRAGAEF